MVTVKPFKGIRYNYKLRKDIGSLLCPPYDVFDYGDKTDRLLKSNPHNFAHILKPEGDNAYENAERTLRWFIAEKVLVREKQDAVYVYQQIFNGSTVMGVKIGRAHV